jgi:hypothetical protein
MYPALDSLSTDRTNNSFSTSRYLLTRILLRRDWQNILLLGDSLRLDEDQKPIITAAEWIFSSTFYAWLDPLIKFPMCERNSGSDKSPQGPRNISYLLHTIWPTYH